MNMNMIVPLLLVSLVSSSVHATDVRYCDKKVDYDVKVNAVEITPNPVARGQPATFSIAASTGKAISGGKLNLDVAYFGWHVHSESHDLCGETPCPVQTGDFVISHSQVLPGFTPPGSYTLKMKIVDANNKQLSCVEFDFSIGFGSSVAGLAAINAI
ncbi:MD-2-related lipid-recognition protein ROSY1-like [Silene latifolia]|uniref:MD-2-related lipid-recognition protein ROSY1-like n=1 Tax=Silene latifolia TaxID=37657 RepID=UPI003D772753